MACTNPCDACKSGGLPVLFTRYAVTFSAEPECSIALNKLKPAGSFTPPPIPMQTASYAVRMLREGVLYVLLERAGERRWMGYMVHPHGYLSFFDPELTPVPVEPASPACEVVVRGAHKSLVWVPDPASVTGLWYFFHPDVVLPDVLQRLKRSPVDLLTLDVAAWANSPTPQPHTCLPGELPSKVAEWAALNDDLMLAGLNEQLYAVMGVDTAEQGYGAGRIPIYVNVALNRSRTDPPRSDIFSADNPLGPWRKTERVGPGTLPSYAQVHRERLKKIAEILGGDPLDSKRCVGIVAACNDAIGIAQETNHWRNKPYRDLIRWGDEVENATGAPTVDRPGAPPSGNKQSRKTRFEIANAWAMLEPLFKQKRIALMIRTLAAGLGVSDRPFILEEMTEAQRRSPMQGRIFRNRQEYDDYMMQLQKQSASLTGPVADKHWSGYLAALDMKGMQSVRAEYTRKARSFEAISSERAPDSLAWIDSAALQNALALYDGDGRGNIAQGARCSAQINGVLEGFNGGGERCQLRLMAWAKDHADNPKNLLWRGFLMNQEAAQRSFKKAMDAAQGAEKGATEYAQLFKDQLDKFSKFNDLVAGKNDTTLKICSAIPMFGFSPVLNLIGHAAFKAGSGNLGFENKLARALMMSMVAGAGSEDAIELHARQRWNLSQITPEKFRASPYYKWSQEQLGIESRAAINKILTQGKGGEFFKMRLTGAMTMTEGILLSFKAKQLAGAADLDAAQRAACELSAAALTTTAAALEVGAMTQEWLAANNLTVNGGTRAMADIRLGGFKLAGSALAGVAGVVGACLDVKDGNKAADEKKIALMWAFFGRGAANVVNFSTGMALGFSYAESLFRHWSQQASGSVLLDGLSNAAKWFSLRRAAIFSMTMWVTVAIMAITWVIGKLDDDELQKWLAKSSFRAVEKPGAKSTPLYDKPGEELTALYGAFKAVTE